MQEGLVALSKVSTMLWVLIGILISLTLPVAVDVLRKASNQLEAKITLGGRIKSAWKKYGGTQYLLVLLAATFVAAVLVLLFELEFFKIRDAVLAGFAWESLLNKFIQQQPSPLKVAAPPISGD